MQLSSSFAKALVVELSSSFAKALALTSIYFLFEKVTNIENKDILSSIKRSFFSRAKDLIMQKE